jgi:hypothetical protein
MSMTPISPVPQRVSQLPMECIGMAVVKMPVTSFNQAPMRRAVARKGSNSIVCSPPTLSTIRGEDG